MKRIVAIIMLLALAICLPGCSKSTSQDTVKTITDVELKELLNISDLYGAETTYKSTVPVVRTKNDGDEEELAYYLYDEATVTAGINFEDLGIDVDNDKNTITITIPEIQILSKYVDPGSFDRIFLHKKDDSPYMDSWDLEIRNEDLDEKLKEEKDELFSSAEESIVSFIEGMTRPWIEESTSYKLIIKEGSDDE